MSSRMRPAPPRPALVRGAVLTAALAVLLAACSGDDVSAPPPAVGTLAGSAARTLAPEAADAATDGSTASAERLPPEVVALRLERAADGLLYTSESDYPFTYVRSAGPASAPLTVEAFREAFSVPADVPVEVVALDDFLARHIERVDPNDPVAMALVPRYRHLRETLGRVVRAPRVFRVGRIAIACYLVGTDAAGHLVGLSTVAIET